ncbi:hypothetical protein EBB04_09775 [Sinorhizobium meliloti]|nr:hypothetical protein EBB04_09775 [Sinorhizobium meliloti]
MQPFGKALQQYTTGGAWPFTFANSVHRVGLNLLLEGRMDITRRELTAACVCAGGWVRRHAGVRHADPIDTSTYHAGFRCVVGTRRVA